MARDERAMARKVLRPTTQAAVTTEAYTVGTFGARDLTELAAELEAQTRAVSTGDLSRGEAMLTAQAHTLDAVFNKMARMALNTDCINQMETFLKLALRAQNQTRTTWEAVSRMQNPAVYMRQTNIAHNQQINNEPDNPRNKLLEQQYGERLDLGAASTAGRVDTTVEAVGAVHRPTNAKREKQVSDECL